MEKRNRGSTHSVAITPNWAKKLVVASIPRDKSNCMHGVCYNHSSFLCRNEAYFYEHILQEVSVEVQAVEDSWEHKYSKEV
jgi:hypothetical protein